MQSNPKKATVSYLEILLNVLLVQLHGETSKVFMHFIFSQS